MDVKTKTTTTMIVLLLTFSFLTLMVGCSNQSPFSVDNSSVDIPPPPLTAETIAAGPAPGYSYMPVDLSPMYNGMSAEHPMYTEQVVRYDAGGSVYFPAPSMLFGPQNYMDWWHGVTIPPEALREDLRISMLAPVPDYAIVEYGPHPYEFECDVQIELSYQYANLASLEAEPADLVIMYWNGTLGEYEEIPSTLNIQDGKLYGVTNHFSRYIIASGRGNE